MKRKKGLLCALSGAVALAIAIPTLTLAPANAANVTLKVVPSDDAFVVEAQPETVMGSLQRVTTTGNPVDRKRAYLKFNLASVPPNATITGAKLKILAATDAGNVGAYSSYTNDWSEKSITWSHQPWWNTSMLSNVSVQHAGAWSTFDVGSAVKNNGTHSFVLAMPAGESTYAVFSSKDNGAGKAPYLEVTYTTSPTPPPPTTTSTTIKSTTTTAKPGPGSQLPVYAHLPWIMPDGTQYGTGDYPWLIRERIDAGWATGAFLYEGGAFRWDGNWQKLVDAFPEGVDLFLSPKSIDGLGEFLGHFPKVWRDRMVFAYFQEPADNHTDPASRAAFRAKVVQAASIVRPLGVKNAVELSDWTLMGPPGTEGGEQALFQMIPPEAVDLIGWSFFEWNTHSLTPHITRIDDWMTRNYPGIPWGAASQGIGVPIGTPVNAPARYTRANSADDSFDTLVARGGIRGSWYDVARPDNPTHGDHAVDAQLLPKLQGLKAGLKK